MEQPKSGNPVQEDKNTRVFIDQGGKFYKGAEAKSTSDMESVHPTKDMLEVLDVTDGVSREVMLAKIIELGNRRNEAVLAPDNNPVGDLNV